MSRLTPLSWRRLKCVFEADGFVFQKRSRKGTSHWIGEKPGWPRPLVIPEYEAIGLDIIHGLMRTANMSRVRFSELLARC